MLIIRRSKLYYTASGIITLCRWPSGAHVGRAPVVSGFFIDIKPFLSHYGPGVDSASNRNEYQDYFQGVKAAGA